MAREEMNTRKFIQDLRRNETWKEFYEHVGISLSQLWKLERLGQSCPPQRVKLLYELAKKQGRLLSQKEIITLLLGGELAGRLADLDLLLVGRKPLDTCLKQNGSQRGNAKILGLEYSTIFHRREGKFRRFWPKRAVEIARRSGYQIDLFELLGADREWFEGG